MITYAIGDIHGRFDLLTQAYKWIEERSGDHLYRVITLGDYVDRGPQSREVIDFLIDKESSGSTICLKGNHERMMNDALMWPDSSSMVHWLQNGGYNTLLSYGGDHTLVPAEHLTWMSLLPTWHEDEHRIYVHAGLKPGVHLADQDEASLLWIRALFLNCLPRELVDGKHVVHGHTPGHAAQRLEHRTNLDSAAYASGNLSVGVFKDDMSGGPVYVHVATA